MRKSVFAILTIFLVIVVFLYYFDSKKDSVEIPKENISEVLPEMLEFSNVSINEKGEKDSFVIDFEYPIIKNASTSALVKINKSLQDFASSTIESSKKDFKILIEDDVLSSQQLSLVSSYSISEFKQPKILNVMFEIHSYSGGAHGITAVKYFVFDTETGKEIFLDDVFKSDYLEELSKISLLAIQKVDPDLSVYTMAEEGTKSKKENFENFALDEAGLKIKFGDYQIGPYSSGRLEIIIPYNELQDILEKDFSSKLLTN